MSLQRFVHRTASKRVSHESDVRPVLGSNTSHQATSPHLFRDAPGRPPSAAPFVAPARCVRRRVRLAGIAGRRPRAGGQIARRDRDQQPIARRARSPCVHDLSLEKLQPTVEAVDARTHAPPEELRQDIGQRYKNGPQGNEQNGQSLEISREEVGKVAVNKAGAESQVTDRVDQEGRSTGAVLGNSPSLAKYPCAECNSRAASSSRWRIAGDRSSRPTSMAFVPMSLTSRAGM